MDNEPIKPLNEEALIALFEELKGKEDIFYIKIINELQALGNKKLNAMLRDQIMQTTKEFQRYLMRGEDKLAMAAQTYLVELGFQLAMVGVNKSVFDEMVKEERMRRLEP